MNSDLLYDLRSVSRRFVLRARSVDALKDVDLRIHRGDFVVVQGASGSGKSSLLRLLGALDRPTSGRVIFEGSDLARMRESELTALRLESFGFVFQECHLIPTLTAVENVEAALAPTGMCRSRSRRRAVELLDWVGLAGRRGHLPNALSGGEQQRVALARALANSPRVVLADEPTGNLDVRTSAEMVGLIVRLAREHGHTVILVTHDSANVPIGSVNVRMSNGQVVE